LAQILGQSWDGRVPALGFLIVAERGGIVFPDGFGSARSLKPSPKTERR